MSTKFFRTLALLTAALPMATIGCTQSTTSEEVAEARKDVAEEQQDVAEARREAMKPTIDADDAEDIQEEKQDVAEAQADLTQTEREFAATQARDTFALDAQKALDAANAKIEELKARKNSEEGAAAETTQQQIDDLQTRRDRLDDAIDHLKGADLNKWTDHRAEVQTAIEELDKTLAQVR